MLKIPAHLITDRQQRDWAIAKAEEALDELEILRSQLRHELDQSFLAFLCIQYGVARQPAEILLILKAARGRTMGRDAIHARMTAVSDHRENLLPKVVDVQLCRIRKAIGSDAIISTWGVGVALSPAFLAELDALEAAFRSSMALSERAA